MPQHDTHAQLGLWFEKYQVFLLQYILKRTGCDHHQAQDLKQEVFTRAYRSLKNRSEEIHYPKRWLEKIANNVCCEFSDKRKRDRENCLSPHSLLAENEEENSFFDHIEDDGSMQPDKIVEQHELVDLLYQGMTSLSENERMALYYHYIKEETINATARTLGRAASTVSKDIQRGLRKLRVHLVELQPLNER